ncbi:MAG: alkaline phosphatase family protein [Nitrospira sp.]|nr:alkaline phosphatase family protein [Nitrospira sp.]
MDAFFELAALGPLPDYLALYFPDNDIWSHQHGPESSGIPLRRFDSDLGRIFDMLGGRQKAIAENTFFVIADHAQVTVGPGEECGIDLDQVLSDYKRLTMGVAWHDQDLFVGPNGRFAMLYLHPNRPRLHDQVFRTLSAEPRIEHILWREGLRYHVYNVQTQSKLCFERGLRYHDRHGNGWRWQGDPAALGLAKSRFVVDFEENPDAFVRISEALDSPASGDYTLTARPGYEFAGNGEDVHLGGGSHGGLTREETLVPFIACGPAVGKRTSILRTTELVQQTMQAFGLSRKRFLLKPAA